MQKFTFYSAGNVEGQGGFFFFFNLMPILLKNAKCLHDLDSIKSTIKSKMENKL